MCCDIAELGDEQRERSCCPDVVGGNQNLFTMASELGAPVTLVTPSSLLSSTISSL